MKTRINYIVRHVFATTAVFALYSCNEFLEVPPQANITESAIRSDPSAAEDLVTGVYNIMWQGNIHGFPYLGVTSIASDNADKGSTPTDADATQGTLDELTMKGDNNFLNDIWTGYYQGVARANQALEFIPLSPADEATRNRMLGEVRFLRAYFYFKLIRLFGNIPLIQSVPEPEEANDPEFQAQAPVQEVYNFILSDLQFATDNLPVKGETETGRATKGAAMGMLAKVHLYQQNWQEAYDLTSAIINGEAGEYGLMENYELIWREVGENSIESLFEVQAGVNSACNAAIDVYSVSQGPRAGGARGWADLGWGFNVPSESLLNAYEEGDIRLDATVIFINPAPLGTVLWDGYRVPSQDSVENARYNYKAYHSRTAEENCGNTGRLPKNLRILRYAEILLIHAEAAYALDDPESALTDINQLRVRANLAPLELGELTREAIWHERRVELGMEHDRFFDLVRQEKIQPGRAVDAFAEHGKTWVKNRHEVFPIPEQQIALSGGILEQNEGYEQ